MAVGQTVEQKKGLFKALAAGLANDQGISEDDVFVNLVEVARENWSFGRGVAQYAYTVPPHLAGG